MVALLGLCGTVLLVGTGLLGNVVSNVGGVLAGFVGTPAETPASAAPSASAQLEAPRLLDSANRYTNKPVWDVRGFVPASIVGKSGYSLRVYVNGAATTLVPLGQTQDFRVSSVPIGLGKNTITASVVGPDGEGARSASIWCVYDNVPPPLAISAPAEASTINSTSVVVTGTTQTGSTVLVHNDTNGLSASGKAVQNAFSITVGIGPGHNDLAVTSTDPAGNSTTTTVSVVRGTTETTIQLHLSNQRIRLADLPRQISMGVTVLDPSGNPVNGATVNFGLSVPGVPTTSFDATTVDGRATWTTTIPKDGVTTGNALVTVLVTLSNGKEYKQSGSFLIL